MKSELLAMAAILSMSGMAVAQGTEPTPASPDMNNIKYMEFPSHDISSQEPPLHTFKEEELTPCYLNAIPVSDLRKQGWFLGMSAVASAFAGHPLGCEDLFGRISPGLQVDFGKWIIPTVGLSCPEKP